MIRYFLGQNNNRCWKTTVLFKWTTERSPNTHLARSPYIGFCLGLDLSLG